MPIALCGIGREVLVPLHWRIASDAVALMLIVELRWVVVPNTAARIVHVSLLLLL